MFDARILTLTNGIRLVTIKKDTQLAAVHAGIKIGSIFERESEKGISHFIEHMLFKGTKQRNNEELNKCLENLGGEYNAYTDNNSTVFSITTLCEELENSIELISDMLQNSIFPENEIEKERDVILAEVRTNNDDIEDISFRKVNQLAFDKSPLKYDTIGEESTIRNFNKQKLKDFYEKYYVPNNCFITIVSQFDHDYVINLVKRYFKEWIWKEFKREEVITENNIPAMKVSYKKDIEQSTIVYLYTLYNLSKEEELALRVLNHRLGESANSILFRELREERGLAYDVYTELDLTNFVKTLYIYTSVGEENIDEALKVIDGCIEDIKDRRIIFNENTINLMKKVLKSAVAFTLEDCTDIGNYVLHQLIDDENIYGFIDDMKKLNNIINEDIYRISRKVLQNPTIHILKTH